MTTTSTPNTPATHTPATECGPDCVYIEGACRCYHGEPAPAQPAIAWTDSIVAPF